MSGKGVIILSMFQFDIEECACITSNSVLLAAFKCTCDSMASGIPAHDTVLYYLYVKFYSHNSSYYIMHLWCYTVLWNEGNNF